MSTSLFKCCVGVDVAAKELVAAVWRYDLIEQTGKRIARRTFPNTTTGCNELLGWSTKRIAKFSAPDSTRYAMEATGVYHELLATRLCRAGQYVSVILPNKIKAYGRSFNRANKTDLSDAELIARYGAERSLDRWTPPSQNQLKIKRLNRQRMNFVRQSTRLKNELSAAQAAADPMPEIIRNYTGMIANFAKMIKRIEAAVRKLMAADELYGQGLKRAMTIPGIGFLTAATLISEMDNFRTFERRAQVVKYAGLDVVANQSGSSINGPGRISKTGNGRIRAALHMAAWTAVRKSGPLQDYYHRILGRTIKKNKALVAVQRKLLVLAYTCVSKGVDYDPEWPQKGVADTVVDHGASTAEAVVLEQQK